jgi:hypothetical protein
MSEPTVRGGYACNTMHSVAELTSTALWGKV